MLKFLIPLLLLIGCGGGGELEKEPGSALGLAFYGMMSPYAGDIIERFIQIQKESDNPATAILWGSFGKERQFVRRYIEAMGEREHTIEIHFSNEVGRRNGRQNSDDWHPFAGIDSINEQLENPNEEFKQSVYSRAEEILDFTREFEGNITWILSLGLEDNYTDAATTNLLAILSFVWPYEIVHNPVAGNCIDGVYCETHGYHTDPKSTRCVISGDGQGIPPDGLNYFGRPAATMQDVSDFITRGRSSGCVNLLWSGQTQGLDRPFTPTRDRRFGLDDQTFIFLRDLIREHVADSKTPS